MPGEPNLLRLQRRVFAALREPIFGDSRHRSELPPRDGAVSPEFQRTAQELISPSSKLAPEERLELYHRQYWYRLLESLAEDFPALRRLVGDEPFWRLAEAFLEDAPPRSFTLRHLGAGLADFLAARPELVPHPEHAQDLARLEYALCQAFEAAEAPPVTPAGLGRGRLGLQPHLILLALRTPADTLWRAALHGGRRPGLAAPTPTPRRFVAVHRQDPGLRVERLPRAADGPLTAIRERGSLEGAMDQVTTEQGLLHARDARRVEQWFSRWTALGWLTRPPALRPGLST